MDSYFGNVNSFFRFLLHPSGTKRTGRFFSTKEAGKGRIARYFGGGVAVFGGGGTITDFDELVLSIVVEKTQAWEMLNNPEYCGRLTVVGLRDVMLRAGYPMKVVQRAINQRGLERLSADMVM